VQSLLPNQSQQAIREFSSAMRDVTGNLPLFPGIFPDYAAPIVRNAPDGVRELSTARWGMPSPVFALKGRNSDPGVTNVRNVSSPHWRRWLGVESRCVVPFTSFSEIELQPDGSRPPTWFAFDESRPLAFFAGIWTRWKSVRKVKEGETENDIFAFLTTEPNAVVAPITRRRRRKCSRCNGHFPMMPCGLWRAVKNKTHPLNASALHPLSPAAPAWSL